MKNKLIYNREQIRKFEIGTVVILKTLVSKRVDADAQIGHVIGFDINYHSEVVIRVKWADGGEWPVHPVNLEIA